MQKRGRKKLLGISKFSGLIIFLITGMVLLGVVTYFNSNIEIRPSPDPISYSPDTPIDMVDDEPRIEDGFLESDGYFDELEMVSECGSSDNHETEIGYIEFSHNIPDMLPLCYTDFYGWHIYATVYGGYVPWDGINNVQISQKGEIKGTFPITWTDVTPADSGCCYSMWDGEIYIDKLCLDSSQIPYLRDPDNLFDSLSYCGGLKPGDYIMDKEVDFCFTMDWSGCHEVQQVFTILSFPHILILIPV